MRKTIGIIITVIGFIISAFFIFFGLWFTLDGFLSGYPELDLISKMFGFGFIGMIIVLIGAYLIQRPKPKMKKESVYEEEAQLKKINRELYIKLGGSFHVGSNLAVRLTGIGCFLCFIAITVVLFSALWINEHTIDFPLLFVYIVFDGFIGLCSYFMCRPRLTVNEDEIICYDRFKKKKVFHYSYITYRRVEIGNMNLFTIFRNPKKKATFYKITYFHELEELVTISTTFKNAKRFDFNVIHHMRQNGYLKIKDEDN